MANKKPNILIIWGDDIGWFNFSANNNGIMGYRTPNIDRVAREGALFTDWYGQQSCTAGRAAGYKSGKKNFKVHIDGYNLLPFLMGDVTANPRKGFLYWSDDGDLMALRVGDWKVHFMVQHGHGLDVWKKPFETLRAPEIYNLRSDPFEWASEDATMFYGKWMADRTFLLVPAQAIVGEFLKTFKEFPPRQKPASFSIDQALEKARQSEKVMAAAAAGK